MLNVVYAECPQKPFMLNAILLNAIMLNAIMLNAIMLNAIMLNAIMLNAVAPFQVVHGLGNKEVG
jgi:hypothetical protein